VFPSINLDLYKRLIRRMADPTIRLLEQALDGTLLPGAEGERLIESRDIYAVFATQEEYKVIAVGGRVIGQVPIEHPYVPGQLMVLAGRRWRVLEVDGKRKEIQVAPASGGAPPRFTSVKHPPADGILQEMRRIYEDTTIPPYLDKQAIELLVEARTTFDLMGLRHAAVARHDGQLLLFPWLGDRRQQALFLALAKAEIETTPLGIAIGVAANDEIRLVDELGRLARTPPPDAFDLASYVKNKISEKFDIYLGDDLLTLAFATERLDVDDLPDLAARMLDGWAASR
jgi:ATP-dependent Lhr-like helicase